ncbi:MAG: adenosylcobinamide-GDP ribazoletransferase [Candidatus Obscuribacterales bacterium]
MFFHRSREHMLEIMRDSRSNNFAVIAALAVNCCSSARLFGCSTPGMVCLAAGARLNDQGGAKPTPSAPSTTPAPCGMGKIWHDTCFPRDADAAALPVAATALLTITLHSWLPAACALACITCGLAACYFVQALLGGQTGDTYGFAVEIAEAGGVFLTALAFH